MQIYMCDHEFRFVLNVRTWKPNSCKHNILKGWVGCDVEMGDSLHLF